MKKRRQIKCRYYIKHGVELAEVEEELTLLINKKEDINIKISNLTTKKMYRVNTGSRVGFARPIGNGMNWLVKTSDGVIKPYLKSSLTFFGKVTNNILI